MVVPFGRFNSAFGSANSGLVFQEVPEISVISRAKTIKLAPYAWQKLILTKTAPRRHKLCNIFESSRLAQIV